VQGSLQAKPLEVYILAGQSNMEGHARISTFDYLVRDPETVPILLEQVFSAEDKAIADGASNAGYHYMGSAKIMAQIGRAFAEAAVELSGGQK